MFDLFRQRTYTAEIADLTQENQQLRTALRNSHRQNAKLQDERNQHKAAAKQAAARANACAAQKKTAEKQCKQCREDLRSVQHAHTAAQEQKERYRAFISYILGNDDAFFEHQKKWPNRITISQMQSDFETLFAKIMTDNI